MCVEKGEHDWEGKGGVVFAAGREGWDFWVAGGVVGKEFGVIIAFVQWLV